MTTAPAAMALLPLLALGVLTACHKPPPLSAVIELPTLPPLPAEQVAAEVNGRQISLAAVQTQAKAAGTSAKAALEALIDAELLAQEGVRRGLARDPQVQWVAKQETVRAYLQHTFETDVTPDNAVTDDMLRRGYKKNETRLNHPLLKDVTQLLLKPLVKNKSAPEDPRVKELAEKIHQRALQAKTLDEFKRLEHEFQDEAHRDGQALEAQVGVTARTGWTAEPFAKAAFDLQTPGQISPVVKSDFGYHVIWLNRDIPAESITYEQAVPNLRKGIWPMVQGQAFERFQNDLAKQHVTSTFPERLSQVKDDLDGDL